MKKMQAKTFSLIFIILLSIIFVSAIFLNSIDFNEKSLNLKASEAPESNLYWIDEEVQSAMEVDFNSYSLSGNGTSDSPYLIQNEIDLAFLSWTIYKGKILAGGNISSSQSDYYYNQYFKQTVDLDLSAYYWQPIGIYYTREGSSVFRKFSGNYDGDGHTISGLFTPAGSTRGYSYQGLFGVVGKYNSYIPTISNVGIIDSYVRGFQYVAGVVAYTLSDVAVTNCFNSSYVDGSGDFVGGVIGYAYRPSAGNENAVISKCYNSGNINGVNFVGGVAGSSDTTISDCYNTASVNAGEYIGGVIGYGVSTITCYNIGEVTGTKYVGGITGYNYYNKAEIVNCFNLGSVISTTKNYMGGIAGYNNGTVSNCYYGGQCDASVGGVNSIDTSNVIYLENIETLAKTKDWYNSDIWTNPWDFRYVWTFDNSPDYLNNGYPVLKYSSEIVYWIDEKVQLAMGVDFDNYSLSGNGTSDTPYLIQSETDIAFLAWTIYNDKILIGGNRTGSYWYFDQYFQQTADLDLSTYEWQPIGIYYTRDGASANRFFSGNYDGNGYIISGLFTPAGSTKEYSYQGLFGGIGSYDSYIPTISNVRLIDSFIQGYQYVAGVVGINSQGVIIDCSNISAVKGEGRIGGIVGENSGTISDCYNLGTVNGSTYVGGVIGNNNSSDRSVSNCYNLGTVNGSDHIGGIIGDNYNGTVNNCCNLGCVNGDQYVGGVAGFNNSVVYNCINIASVNGDSSIGGIVGRNFLSIDNCYNTGLVSGKSFVGGIVGYNFGTVSNSGVESRQINGSSSVGIICGTNSSTNSLINCFGIVDIDLPFLGNGTCENCVWINAAGKYYIGSDFSDFVWINQDSCPIPRSLTSIGEYLTEDITNQLLSSSEWQSA